FVGYVFSTYFIRDWGLFAFGWDSWQARFLPSLALALAPSGYIARLVRSAVVETLNEDYVRTARAKGLHAKRILWVHVVRNSLGAALTLATRRTTSVAGRLFVLILVYALVWPLVSPYGADDVDFSRSRQGPSPAHPLGTDQFGRDLLARLAGGGRTTLAIVG